MADLKGAAYAAEGAIGKIHEFEKLDRCSDWKE